MKRETVGKGSKILEDSTSIEMVKVGNEWSKLENYRKSKLEITMNELSWKLEYG